MTTVSEKITSFTQLIAWQRARDLAIQIHKLIQTFPAEEKFGLSSQISRCSISVAGNIAEGFSRKTGKDKAQFYSIALGSLTETLSHSYLALDFGYINQADLMSIEQKTVELHKIINGLIRSAKSRV